MDVVVPWLDCWGPGFDPFWGRLHAQLLAGGSPAAAGGLGPAGGAGGLASLGTPATQEILDGEEHWEDRGRSPQFLPGGALGRRAAAFARVLSGELHPAALGGYCHFGVVTLLYLRGAALAPKTTGGSADAFAAGARARARAGRALNASWRLLAQPGGEVLAFDYLESSRWGRILTARSILQAAATVEAGRGLKAGDGEGGAEPGTALASALDLLRRPPPPARSPAGATGGRALASRRNFTALALSTHAAVLEPVSSLRAALRPLGARLLAQYLGLMHPSSNLPCDLEPEDSVCSDRRGWGADARRFLHPLGDMSDPRFREAGFLDELRGRVRRLEARYVAGKVDLVICAHPFLLCALIRPLTGLFMLTYLTPTPLTLVPEADRPWVLSQLKAFAENGCTCLFAASPIYALHALQLAGARVPAVRPSGLYVADRHQWRRGGKHSRFVYLWMVSGLMFSFCVLAQNFLLYGREAGLPLQDVEFSSKERLVMSGSGPFAEWGFLAAVRCVVLLPWDLQLTVLPELYALGVPLLLPTARYLASYALRILESGRSFFWSVNPIFAGRATSSLSPALAHEPWLPARAFDPRRAAGRRLEDEEQLLYWLGASDIEAFGHTLRFSSVPELLQLAACTPQAELAAAAAGMRREWRAERAKAAETYEALTERVLGAAGETDRRGRQ